MVVQNQYIAILYATRILLFNDYPTLRRAFELSFQKKPLGDRGGGGGLLPSFYNGLYGKTPPERGIFFRLQVYEREGILLVEVYERVGTSVCIFDL